MREYSIIPSIGVQGILLIYAIGLAAFAFWLWMLIDCATKESAEANTKVVWIVIIAVTGVIGAGLYWLMRRPQRMEEVKSLTRGGQRDLQFCSAFRAIAGRNGSPMLGDDSFGHC
jgi:hypothetical protein